MPLVNVGEGSQITVGEAAVMCGYTVYDCALPQPWVDHVFELTGTYPVGMFVWCYDTAKNFGEPAPLTPDAAKLLRSYEQARRLRGGR
jgi:hypothetical protein